MVEERSWGVAISCYVYVFFCVKYVAIMVVKILGDLRLSWWEGFMKTVIVGIVSVRTVIAKTVFERRCLSEGNFVESINFFFFR